jgi:hypothetical protein
MNSDEDTDNDNDGRHERRYRTTTFADRYAIFFACRSNMVDGLLKHGIQKNLARFWDSAV